MSLPRQHPIEILVDADACPVKDEVYRVAERHGAKVTIVANSYMRVPRHTMVELVVVGDHADAADDWIAERAGLSKIVVTADVPLAHRVVTAGARVLTPTGREFTEASIGMALASRDLMDSLRGAGEVTGGPKPFQASDRSRFLSTLHDIVEQLKREATS